MLYSFRSLQNAGNAISENLKFNIFQGACPRTLLEVCRDFGAHLPPPPPPPPLPPVLSIACLAPPC